MKVIEIRDDETVCCPVCNQVILANDGKSSPQECPHTLLIAHDEGIEFCAKEINAEALEVLTEDASWDDVISNLDRPGAIFIKMYQGAPSFFGSYFLFSA